MIYDFLWFAGGIAYTILAIMASTAITAPSDDPDRKFMSQWYSVPLLFVIALGWPIFAIAEKPEHPLRK